MKTHKPTAPHSGPKPDLNSDITPPDRRAPEADMPGRPRPPYQPDPPHRPDEHRRSPLSNDRDTQRSPDERSSDEQDLPSDDGYKGPRRP